MNAGKSYANALWKAQANANYANAPRYLHAYGGVWWISKTPVSGAEIIEPQREMAGAPYRKRVYLRRMNGRIINVFWRWPNGYKQVIGNTWLVSCGYQAEMLGAPEAIFPSFKAAVKAIVAAFHAYDTEE